jgi:hypothetical protein
MNFEKEESMRVTRTVLIAALSAILGFSAASAQDEMAGKIGVGPVIGALMPIQYLKSDEGGGYASAGFAGGVFAEYFINDDISVGGKFMYDRFGTDYPGADVSGNWTMMEFGVFGRCQFMKGKPTRPYARAGLLMGKAKLKTENGAEVESDVAIAPGAELAGGVIHKLQENVSLFGEVNWTALATDGKDVDVTTDGTDSGTIEAEKHLQWVGIKAGVIIFLGGKTQ